MAVSKSLFASLGTGAGVAWPLFGIVSSALSLAIGGLSVVGFGAACALLFLIIGLPVFYFSYRQEKQQQEQLEAKFVKGIEELVDTLYAAFILSGDSDYVKFVQRWPRKKNGFPKLLEPFLSMLISKMNDSGTKVPDQHVIRLAAKHYFAAIETMLPAPPAKKLAQTAFLSFVGTFGSIAGCSAGMMGVISSLGIMAGFGAVPLLAAIILSTSIICGIYAATHAMASETVGWKKTQVRQQLKSFNRTFSMDILVESRLKEEQHESVSCTLFYPKPGHTLSSSEQRVVPSIRSKKPAASNFLQN
ncbi:hypothetical protein Lrub_2361 [Legionella rubrilucens]|uniref:Transmembrane protein n=1 Tax=Legionella rubrilucens TaxID=458 RepID=A0A0W0XLV0_9GAMM|nr:hypothetical protein [Legionella rubrilucens]KTD45564.1 hypothetical protein Lrub_2361 [Legionella rubrilucens]